MTSGTDRSRQTRKEINMGDVGELWNAVKAERKSLRDKYGIECQKCKELRPKTNASILLPGQRCKVDGYRDPRQRLKNETDIRKNDAS